MASLKRMCRAAAEWWTAARGETRLCSRSPTLATTLLKRILSPRVMLGRGLAESSARTAGRLRRAVTAAVAAGSLARSASACASPGSRQVVSSVPSKASGNVL